MKFCHLYFHPNRALPLSVLNRAWGRCKLENQKITQKGVFLTGVLWTAVCLQNHWLQFQGKFTFYLSHILNLDSSKAFCDLPDVFSWVHSRWFQLWGALTFVCLVFFSQDNPDFFGTSMDLSPISRRDPFLCKEFCSCWPHELWVSFFTLPRLFSAAQVPQGCWSNNFNRGFSLFSRRCGNYLLARGLQ